MTAKTTTRRRTETASQKNDRDRRRHLRELVSIATAIRRASVLEALVGWARFLRLLDQPLELPAHHRKGGTR